MAASSPSKRRDTDLMRLMMSDFKVHLPDESCLHTFSVLFQGPAETPYEGGSWKVHVSLPPEYPFKSPSIGFMNRLFHPNVDEISGSVCLDVINQTWSPMFDLVNVFSVFLPQLLRYPNPNDPLNGEAANLLLRDADKYNDRVREYVKRYASAAIVMEDEGEEQHGKKPRAAFSSSLSSSASTDNESPSPSTSPMMHPMAAMAGMNAVSLSGESSLLAPLSEGGSYMGGSASSSSGSNEESPDAQDEEDDGNDTDVSELSDIDI